MFFVVSDRSLGAQLQGHRRHLWGVLEQHRGQSRGQCFRRLGKHEDKAICNSWHLVVFCFLCFWAKETNILRLLWERGIKIPERCAEFCPTLFLLGVCSWSPKIADSRLWWWNLECAANCLLLTSASKLSTLQKSSKVEWKKTSRRGTKQLTAEEPTPTDFSAPYSLSMCVLRCAYLKLWLREPRHGSEPQLPWAQPCFKRFLMRKCCDLSGPRAQLLSGWKGVNTKTSFI